VLLPECLNEAVVPVPASSGVMLAALERSGSTPIQSLVCLSAAAIGRLTSAAMVPGPLLAILRAPQDPPLIVPAADEVYEGRTLVTPVLSRDAGGRPSAALCGRW